MTTNVATIAAMRADRDGVLDEQGMTDGQTLIRRSWPLLGARRGILIVHGLGEHSGRYAHVATWFFARGYDVRSYDQRGHGRSPGRRGALRHTDDLLTDLAAIYADYAAASERAGHTRAPLLLGHSMGGLVALRAVLDGRVRPSALLLSSPALRSYASPGLHKLAHVLGTLAPGLPLRNGLAIESLSHDATVVAAYRDDPLCHATVTPRLADFIFRAGPACIADAATLKATTLLLVAGSDRLVDPAGSHDFAAAAAHVGQLTTRFFDTLYHELMNEAEPARGQVMKQLGDWLERLPKT